MDETISLGWNCESASRAAEAGIRRRKADGYLTCPFDECITNYEGIMLCIKEDFKYFCDPLYLDLIEAPFTVGGIFKHERLVYNTRYKFIFNHESPDHANLHIIQNWAGGKNHYIDNNFALFIERYNRRINNFRHYVQTSSITFVIGKLDPDVSKLDKVLREVYPNLVFNIYHIFPSTSAEHVNGHHHLMDALKFQPLLGAT